MAYKPVSIQNAYKGISGVAQIKYSPDKKAIGVKMAESNKVYKIPYNKESVPMKKIPEGKWYVTLDSEGKKMQGIRPVSGMHTVKVQKITAKEGEQPAPKTVTNEYGQYQSFTVLLEVVSDKAKGMVIPLTLRYNFGPVQENGKTVTGYTHDGPKSVHTPRLKEFMEVAGAWDKGPMPYKDNLLPLIETRLLKAAKLFDVLVKEGWVVNCLETEADSDVEEVDDEVDDEESTDEDDIESEEEHDNGADEFEPEEG